MKGQVFVEAVVEVAAIGVAGVPAIRAAFVQWAMTIII